MLTLWGFVLSTTGGENLEKLQFDSPLSLIRHKRVTDKFRYYLRMNITSYIDYLYILHYLHL